MENNIEWDISVIYYDAALQQCICSGSIFCRAFEETVSWIEVSRAVDLKRILYSWAALLNCRLHTYSCQSLRSGICVVPEKKWAEKKPRMFYLTKVYPSLRDGSCPLATIKPHFQSCNSNSLLSFSPFPDFLLMSCQSNRGNLWEEKRGKERSWGVWRSRQRWPASTSDQSLHKCS